jgi:hypothetical protein
VFNSRDVERVLGGVEQDASGPGYGNAAQAGGAGGNGDSDIEGEEGFAALRLPKTSSVPTGRRGASYQVHVPTLSSFAANFRL